MRRRAVVALALILASQADAAHCPYGEIYRVRLDQCVGVHSKLAAPYVGRRVVLRLPLPKRPPTAAPAPATPVAVPIVERLREALATRGRLDPDAILLSRAATLTSEVPP